MKRFALIVFVTTLALIGSLAFFYWQYDRYAMTLIYEQRMHDEKANAVKHAVAAAETFLLLAPIAGEKNAESMVLNLGKLSEYMEKTLPGRIVDSPAELFKDMHNNQVGILAARWQRHTHPFGDVRKTILKLADEDVLIARAANAMIPASIAQKKGYEAVADVDAYFQTQRDAISTRSEAAFLSLTP